MCINFTHWFPYRHKGSSGGCENHTPSRNPALDTTILVATLELAQECSAIVWGAGGFSQLLFNQVSSARYQIGIFHISATTFISYIMYVCPIFWIRCYLLIPMGRWKVIESMKA